MTSRRRCATLFVALVAALALATAAGAEIVTRTDSEGRTITFDVRAPNVDVDWYAAILRAAAHGDEISRVTIRIVPEEDVPALCGAAAAACYSLGGNGGRMVVPAGKDLRVAATFLHEYGHHLDRSWGVSGVKELNGTPVWWELRGMAALLAQRTVAFDYSRGWDRSIGEIFAEDYAWIHIPYQHSITWLSPPDDALRTALFAELGGQPTAQLPEIPVGGPARDQPQRLARGEALTGRAVRPARPRPPGHDDGDREQGDPRRDTRADGRHLQRHSRRDPAVHEGPLDPDDQRPEPRPRRVQRAARQHDGRSADVHASPAARDRDLSQYRHGVCFELDSSPPIPVIRGAAVSHEDLVLEGRDGNRFAAFGAYPDQATGIGIVVLPDVRGLYRFYEELALRFAERGYTAIAFDYFGRTAGVEKRDDDFDVHGARAADDARGRPGRRRGGRRTAARDLQRRSSPSASALADATRGSPPPAATTSTARSASTGAPGRAGRLAGADRSCRRDRSPILGLMGGDDPRIPPEDVSAFERALEEAGVEHELVTYPGAPHSFFDRKQEQFADASEDAWNRVLAFIKRYAIPR